MKVKTWKRLSLVDEREHIISKTWNLIAHELVMFCGACSILCLEMNMTGRSLLKSADQRKISFHVHVGWKHKYLCFDTSCATKKHLKKQDVCAGITVAQ